jgi:HrpA-like RNA helicase
MEQQEGEAPPPPPRQWLPVATEALRDRIVEKVKENRVTLIVGDTGCGNDLAAPPSIYAFVPASIGGIWAV